MIKMSQKQKKEKSEVWVTNTELTGTNLADAGVGAYLPTLGK